MQKMRGGIWILAVGGSFLLGACTSDDTGQAGFEETTPLHADTSSAPLSTIPSATPSTDSEAHRPDTEVSAPSTPTTPAPPPAERQTDSGDAANSNTADARATDDGATDDGATDVRAGTAAETELLRRAARLYTNASSLQADFSQKSVNPILRTTVESSGTLYQKSPDLFLMRFSDPEGDIIVSDGTYFWIYYPSVDRKQVMRMPASAGAGAVDLRAQFIGDPLERFEVVPEGEDDVRGRKAEVFHLTPRQPMGYKTLKIWIDKGDHLIRRFEITEENGLTRLFDLTNLELDPRLSDDLFEFTIPEGAHLVERG